MADFDALSVGLQGVLKAALAHRDHALNRECVAQIDRIFALVRELKGLGSQLSHVGMVGLPEGERRRGPERLRAERSRNFAGDCERRVRPSPALLKLSKLAPVAPEGHRVAQRQDSLAALDGPSHPVP